VTSAIATISTKELTGIVKESGIELLRGAEKGTKGELVAGIEKALTLKTKQEIDLESIVIKSAKTNEVLRHCGDPNAVKRKKHGLSKTFEAKATKSKLEIRLTIICVGMHKTKCKPLQIFIEAKGIRSPETVLRSSVFIITASRDEKRRAKVSAELPIAPPNGQVPNEPSILALPGPAPSPAPAGQHTHNEVPRANPLQPPSSSSAAEVALPETLGFDPNENFPSPKSHQD